jgi:hypothetical protein
VETGASLGCLSVKNPSPQLMLNVWAISLASRFQGVCQNHHIHRIRHLADQGIATHNQLANLLLLNGNGNRAVRE